MTTLNISVVSHQPVYHCCPPASFQVYFSQGHRKWCGQYGHGRTIISQIKKNSQKIHLTVLYNMTIYFHKLAGLCSDIAAMSVQVVWIMLVS